MVDNYVQVPPDSTGKKVRVVDNGDGTVTQEVYLDSASLTVLEDAPAQNVVAIFREAFEGTEIDPTKWTISKAATDLIFLDGNAIGASYAVISQSPWTAGNESTLETIPVFSFPVEVAVGLSLSQRGVGQETSIEFVDTETPLPDVPEVAISSVSQTTTTLTVNTATAHGLVIGKCIGLRGCADTRANYPQLVVASIPSTTQFTATAGPNGTIPSTTISTTGGYVYFRERLGRANNGGSQIFEQTNAAQSSIYVRSAQGDAYPSGTLAGNQSVTCASSASIQAINSANTRAFTPTSIYSLIAGADRLNWLDVGVDSIGASTSRLARSQVVPDPTKTYKLRFRIKSQPSMPRPIAKIVSIVKTGTTTATVTTDVEHNLSTTSYVQIYGSRDTTNFPNLTAQTVVASIVSTTQFTIVIGPAATATSYGGYVSICDGQALIASNGAVSQVVTTAACASDVLTLVGSANWATALIGDTVEVIGIYDTAGTYMDVDGAYRVSKISTTTMVLEPIDGRTGLPTFTTTNCSGGLIKRTDTRISFVRVFDYKRLRVESVTRGNGDAQTALPTYVQGGAITPNATTSNLGYVGLQQPLIVADVASAAITTTTTTSAITPAMGTTYIVQIPVTVVSGTNPTLDVSVEESDDSGTNWFTVYQFPRITATGAYRSPALTLRGNRVRYVQTLTGTSPSFTRAVNRMQRQDDANLRVQFIDRTIVPNTLNSVTPTYFIDGCKEFNLVVRCTAQTTPATMAMMFSEDGANWYTSTTTLATINGIARATYTNELWKFARATVTVAGTGITLGEVTITGRS